MARTKKSDSVPVRIRFKELENGNKSIYLDIYYEKKRRYEFLKLYLVPENSAEARAQNEHTLKAANAIKAQRILDITNKRPQKDYSDKAKVLLTDWLYVYSEKKQRMARPLWKRSSIPLSSNLNFMLPRQCYVMWTKISLKVLYST